MRRFIAVFAAWAVVVILGASAAKADSIKVFKKSPTGFKSNDTVNWGSLGIGVRAPDGTTVASSDGFMTTTVTYGINSTQMRVGATACEAPGAGCTWSGDFVATASLLTNISPRTSSSQGAIDLTFSQGIANVGFDIDTFDSGGFNYVVQVLDGSTVLDMFSGFASALSVPMPYFIGIEDLTAADITGIKIATYRCSFNSDPTCVNGFAISNLLVQDTIPEPASLLLLGSGLALLALLRRKFAAWRQEKIFEGFK